MRQRGGSALTRIPAIASHLVTLRGLEFTTTVPVDYQDEAGARRLLEDDLRNDLPPELAERITASWVHLGLLPAPIDLPKFLANAQIALAGAYYTCRQKQVFLREVLDDELPFKAGISHELTHALQDQHFDLSGYLAPTLDSDARHARLFVVEGDAMLIEYAVMQGERMPPSPRLVDHFERVAASASLSHLTSDERAELPLLVVGPNVEVYFKGPLVILSAYRRGGWREVARLYADPPQSTAQVLHPETKLYPTRQQPRRVEVPLLAAHREVDADVVGELGWRLYFAQWKISEPAIAADGWAGDRYRVMRGPDGSLIGVLVSSWDRADDANEFVDAYVRSVAVRFPSATAADALAHTGALRSDGRRIFVRRNGTTVVIVDGAVDHAQLDVVIAGVQVH